MDLRPTCPDCESRAVILSERDRNDERHAACSACGREWILAEDWWRSLAGGVIPQRLDDGPATALP